MSQPYYTQTPNFVSYGSSDVDPRTRLFSFNCVLASLKGNAGMGPELEMAIGYNATDGGNLWALGTGMGYSFTVYDKNAGNLILSTGESYKVNDTGPAPIIQQQKIPTVIFTKLETYKYQVVDRNGNVTLLQDQLQNGLFRPAKISTPLGRALTLNWVNSSAGFALSSVVDDDNKTLCSLSYTSSETTLNFYPGTPDSYSISLSTTNNYLTRVTHSQLGNNTPWTLSYQNVGMGNGLQTLVQVKTPTGLVKTAIYNYGQPTGIIRFPTTAGLPALPAVTQFTVSPGQGQPDMVTRYSATPGNNDSAVAFMDYLGYDYDLGSGWSPNSDFLYGEFDPAYIYQTYVTQTGTDGGNEITALYTYNSYHLLASILTTQGNTTHLAEMKYYLDDYAYQSFDNLPSQFQCPKLQTETWTSNGQSFTEHTGFEYDKSGNLTRQISLCDEHGQPTAHSTLVESVYYPASGEPTSADSMTGCPADPWGFTRWLKSETTTPPVINGYNDVPTRTSLYRYLSLNTRGGMPVPLAILPAQETHTATDMPTPNRAMLSRVQSYITDSNSPHYGRPAQQQGTVFDVKGTGWTQTLDTAWRLDDTSLSQTGTLTTHDHQSLATTLSHSRYSWHVLSAIDPLNNRVDLTYDALGRLLSKVQNKGTPYEDTSTWNYTLTASGSAVTEIATTVTDSKGNAVKMRFDGMGRLISQLHNAKDAGLPNNWLTTGTTVWDVWGRMLQQTSQDYPDPKNVSRTYTLTTQAQYDDWGQQVLAKLSSGQNSHHVWDPIKRNTISQLQVANNSLILGSHLTKYDDLHMPVTDILRDKNGTDYAQTTRVFDGLGRLRKETDPLQHSTSYTYDQADRMASKTLPDGSTERREYAPFSQGELPVSVSLNNRVMGTQTFDGLGRRVENVCGGRKETATYSGAKMSPDHTTDAKSQTLNYSYIAQLGNALSTLSGPGLSQSFSYENSTGRLLSASESGSQSQSLTWWPSGAPDTQQFSRSGSTTRNTGYSWTLGGRMLTGKDIAGNTQTINYDMYGRPATLTDPRVAVTLAWDAAGRLHSQTAVSTGSTDTLTTTLTWDDYGREIQRDITPSTGSILTVKQTYRKNNQLESRTTLSGGTTLRTENYTYDERNRLTNYSCSGSELPCDAYGQPISSQKFTLDIYSNITTCVTTLGDGSKDTTTYLYGNAQDPCQLTGVTHTLTTHYPASIQLTYDANGRMTKDETGRTLTYDAAGRLSSISGTDGNSQYGYDAFDQLVMQSLNGTQTRELYYRGNTLVNEVHVEQKQQTRFIPGFSGTSAVSDEAIS